MRKHTWPPPRQMWTAPLDRSVLGYHVAHTGQAPVFFVTCFSNVFPFFGFKPTGGDMAVFKAQGWWELPDQVSGSVLEEAPLDREVLLYGPADGLLGPTWCVSGYSKSYGWLLNGTRRPALFWELPEAPKATMKDRVFQALERNAAGKE